MTALTFKRGAEDVYDDTARRRKPLGKLYEIWRGAKFMGLIYPEMSRGYYGWSKFWCVEWDDEAGLDLRRYRGCAEPTLRAAKAHANRCESLAAPRSTTPRREGGGA